MAERTLPTAGISPIEAYLAPTYKQGTVGLPAGYFELVPTQGGVGTAGASGCAVYAKVNLGTTKPISGRASVIEARLDTGVCTATNPNDPTMSLLCLDFNGGNTAASITNSRASYIMLRDRSATQGLQMYTLLDFFDISSFTADSESALLSTTGDLEATHTIRCMAAGAPLWILCSNVHA